MSTTMSAMRSREAIRTPEEVFASHREAIENLDLGKLMADYAEDAVMLTPQGGIHGREAILRDFFQTFLAQFPDAKIKFERITFEAEICLVEWSAEASAMSIPVGLGVLFIEDGLIQRQVEWFQLIPKE